VIAIGCLDSAEKCIPHPMLRTISPSAVIQNLPPNVADPALLDCRGERSMTYIVAYVAVLLVFGTIDAVWLTTMGAILYRPALGDILAQNLRVVPAIAFYLAFPIGIVVFAVLPGLRAQSPVTAATLALLFGALAYATYDLTNYATLRNWTLQITVVDIAYGALASSIAATAAFFAVRILVC
jgi:uncharacterized membrane protein